MTPVGCIFRNCCIHIFPSKSNLNSQDSSTRWKRNEAPILLIVNHCSVPRPTACLVGCVVYWSTTPHYVHFTATYLWVALCECVEIFVLVLYSTVNCDGFYKVKSLPSGAYLSHQTLPVVKVCHFIITKPAWMSITNTVFFDR